MTEWIKTSEQMPEENQRIQMTCKHWLQNWEGNFEWPYIDDGFFFQGTFWVDCEGARIDDPIFWRPLISSKKLQEEKCNQT